MHKKNFWHMSWNPAWGCLYNCPYCYARKIANRYAVQIAEKEMKLKFGENWKDYKELDQIRKPFSELILTLRIFAPTWLESNYQRSFPKKPSIIFVNSMSDPAYWKQSWYEKIVKRICDNFQHTFVVLTKQPEAYKKYHFPHNTVLGITITKNQDVGKINIFFSNVQQNKRLISFEPLQEKLKIKINYGVDWIHVGQESGNRKERIIVTSEMIEPFFDLETKVFMKKNLEGVVPGRKLRRESI